jgi:putative thioredoxin
MPDLAHPQAPAGAPAPETGPTAGGAASVPGGVVIDVTDATFNDLVETSRQVPVILDLWATWCEPCKQLGPVLERLAQAYGGQFLLARVDVDQSPQIRDLMRAQSIPLVVALLGGRAMPLFVGAQPEAQIREVIDQVLKAAAQAGVTGRVTGGEAGPPPLPPLEQAALDAIERGDLGAAKDAYHKAIAENPADSAAKVGLEQVELMERSQAQDAAAALTAAAGAPEDIPKALAAADADMAAGRPEAAFQRLLGLIGTHHGEDRETLRSRLVEYFDIVGPDDARVAKARRTLANLLF